jgi:hypothetical protein
MRIAVSDIGTLRTVCGEWVARAGHHRHQVERAVLPLIGALTVFADPGSIQVRPSNHGGQKVTNICRFRKGGQPFVLAYDHRRKVIRLKRGTLQGLVIGSFDSTTADDKIHQVFAGL